MWTEQQKARFWANVSKKAATECWPWQASITTNGYGQSWTAAGPRKAHRIAWELTTGARLPHNVTVRHICGNRACCNPDHLRSSNGTKVSETAHMRGSLNVNAKLDERQARIIKYKLPDLTIREIAKAFDVSYKTIWSIRNGKTWTHT